MASIFRRVYPPQTWDQIPENWDDIAGNFDDVTAQPRPSLFRAPAEPEPE